VVEAIPRSRSAALTEVVRVWGLAGAAAGHRRA
jgi:hypothetical protein